MQGSNEERIETGADVIGSDGDKLGTVAYVVVQPPKMHLTDLVVSTGLLGHDRVVPIDRLDRVADGQVYLSLDQAALEQLDDYVEVRYQTPPETWGPPAGFFYPTQSVLWPAGMGGYYPEPTSVEINAPAGTVGLSEGMDVESRDGHKIGSIKAVDTDATSGDVTGLVIKEGHLFSHEVQIDGSQIASIDAGRVTLQQTRDELEAAHQA